MNEHLLLHRQSDIGKTVCNKPRTILGTGPDQNNLTIWFCHTLEFGQAGLPTLFIIEWQSIEAANTRNKSLGSDINRAFALQNMQKTRGRFDRVNPFRVMLQALYSSPTTTCPSIEYYAIVEDRRELL